MSDPLDFTRQDTVLVVDDVPDNLALMTGVLRGEYKTKVATSGARGLEIATADHPDLILLDIDMPGMDGYEVCRRLKENPATADIPVIFLTAKTAVEDEQKGFEVGGVDYITKPISAPIVLARVKTHLLVKGARDFLKDQTAYLEAEIDRRTREAERAERGRANQADRGLSVAWYNLPEAGREAYLDWLHGEYIPAMLKRSGYLWAAHYASVDDEKTPRRTSGAKHSTTDPDVPRGDRYILLFGAENSNVFGNPLPHEIHAQLPPRDREMLTLRIGERRNIMTEAARLDGPEAKNYRDGMNLAPCIQMGSFQAQWQDEEEALSWYAKWRMPSMSRLAGCVRVRKLASVAGWAKQSILYEFTSQEARNHFLHSHEDGEENRVWTDKVIAALVHAPGSANVGLRLWPPVRP